MRCERTPPKETKVCPVCDASIDADVQTCPSCLTDLSLFDFGSESTAESPEVRASEGKSIDDILASIMEGRSDRPEIFETLKSVASSQKADEELLVEEPPSKPAKPPEPPKPAAPPPKLAPALEPEVPGTEEFLCPVCETVVGPSDRVCPGCGAEFSEGETTEYECPVCKASVPADAAQCPSCGVHFETAEAETPPRSPSSGRTPLTPPGPVGLGSHGLGIPDRIENLRSSVRSTRAGLPVGDRKLLARELPKLVNDVKPLLVSAKRIGLDIESGKRLINDAVTAGKKRDTERSVRLIADARRALDVAFVDFIGGKIAAFAAEIEKAGGGSSGVRQQLGGAVGLLEKRDYDGAWDGYRAASDAFQAQATEYNEVRSLGDGVDKLLAVVRPMGMDSRDVERLSKQVRDAVERHDLPGALRLAKEANEKLLRTVPDFVQEEMRKARNDLLDLKMRGYDISKPVVALKEASACQKDGRWDESLRLIQEFRKELDKASRG